MHSHWGLWRRWNFKDPISAPRSHPLVIQSNANLVRLGRDFAGGIKVTDQLTMKNQSGSPGGPGGTTRKSEAEGGARGPPGIRKMCCLVAGAEGPMYKAQRALVGERGDLVTASPVLYSLSYKELNWVTELECPWKTTFPAGL